MAGVNVPSEIMPLKKVLLHRPGDELLNLTPNTLEELLFDDIPFLKVAQEEHDAFAKILRDEGVEVEETRIAISDVVEGAENGNLKEVFGTGTAAVISPVGDFGYGGKDYAVGGGKMGELSRHVYDELTGIQTGRVPDRFGWVVRIK